jgi:antitoxin VapB
MLWRAMAIRPGIPWISNFDLLLVFSLMGSFYFVNVYTYCIYYYLESIMSTARVFRSGNSQAVRLPKQFRVKSKELEIFRRGDEIVLREKRGNMARAFELLADLPEEIELVRREKDPPQKRKGL